MSIAVIGGSGLDQLAIFNHGEIIKKTTPYGDHSGPVIQAYIGDRQAQTIFLPRHGSSHEHPPHNVNYRANMWLLKSLGVEKILACNVVGGITENMSPGTLVAPDQLIDYTWGRKHTFFEGVLGQDDSLITKGVEHIDFTHPYTPSLRKRLLYFFDEKNIRCIHGATYGCTQGPRLETAAEVLRLKKDGCDIVGMTAMPEAALARELSMQYTALSLVVNWAPGIASEELSIDKIMKRMSEEMKKVCEFMPKLVDSLR